MRTDNADVAIDHDRLRVQADPQSGFAQRHQAIVATAENAAALIENRAVARCGIPAIPSRAAAANRDALDAALLDRGRAAVRATGPSIRRCCVFAVAHLRGRLLGRAGGSDVDRRVHRLRLGFEKVESKFAQIAALVLERQRVHRERIGGRQAVAGNGDHRRIGSIVHALEHLACALAEHKVRGLHQYCGVRALDQRAQVAGDRVAQVRGVPIVLAGAIGDVFGMRHQHRRIDEAARDLGLIVGRIRHRQHARRAMLLRQRGQRRRPLMRDQVAGHILEPRQRQRALVIPEQLEHALHLAPARASEQHVAIAEIQHRIPVVIIVGNVAATGNADAIVHQQQLVVHALVDPAEAA